MVIYTVNAWSRTLVIRDEDDAKKEKKTKVELLYAFIERNLFRLIQGSAQYQFRFGNQRFEF